MLSRSSTFQSPRAETKASPVRYPRRYLVRTAVALIVLILLTGWGSTGHKIINKNGALSLPPEMLGFIQRAQMLADSASNADNRKSKDPSESPKHFIDIDDYAEFASRSVSHSLDSLVLEYGLQRVTSNGTVPWATVATMDSLTAQMKRGDWNRAWSTAADLGHYVGDAHQPLHCAINYDGQLTGNKGIHSRYESSMIDRYQQSISFRTDAVVYVDSPIDFIFNYIYESNSYCDSIFNADNYAKSVSGWNGSGQEPDSYYTALWARAGGFTILQLQRAVDAFSSLLYTAWVHAGRPPVPTTTGVIAASTESTDFKLENAFPNPCNPSTTIRYLLAKDADVSLKVYDAVGRRVITLADEHQRAGIHQVQWIANVPSGTYVCWLVVGESRSATKIAVIK